MVSMARHGNGRRKKQSRKVFNKRASRRQNKQQTHQRQQQFCHDDILNALDKQQDGVSLTELIGMLDGSGADSRNIRAMLQELLDLGLLLEPRPGRFVVSGSNGEYQARISLDQDGNRFANFPDGSSCRVDPQHDMNCGDGDVVHVLLDNNGQALIIRIVERIGQEMIGTLNFQSKDVTFIPDKRRQGDLPITGKRKKILNDFQSGDRVVAELVENPSGGNAVKLLRILDQQSPEVADFERVRMSYDLPQPFDKSIEDAARKEVINTFNVGDRLDCRKDFIFTIDPETAKDFDDAISISRGPRGVWKIGVHIADVSHFVKEHGIIDKEAVLRGTSCYLINRVIPMLPEVLSNGMCSLVPNEDRYALSVFIELDKQGTITKCEPRETVIRSQHRLSYEEALSILEGKTKNGDYPDKLVETVKQCNSIAQLLRRKRTKNGSLNLFSVERNFVLDVEGNPIEVKQETSDIAHQLIEEFMLLANRAVASWLHERKSPAVYRVHGEPDEERFGQFLQTVSYYGIDTAGGTSGRKGLQQILNKIEKEPVAPRIVLNYLCLRSFQKATYQVNNIGHYALAFPKYLHFTSPIRRYPDLIIHRLVKQQLGIATYAQTERRVEHLDALARQSSYLERRAEMAERDIRSTKGARYLSRKIGESFEAVVVGASNAGLFVDLLETGLGGLIPIRDLGNDFWELDDQGMALIGRDTGTRYSIGTEVEVQVVSVDIHKAEVNLSLAAPSDDKEKNEKRDKAKKKGSLKISDYL